MNLSRDPSKNGRVTKCLSKFKSPMNWSFRNYENKKIAGSFNECGTDSVGIGCGENMKFTFLTILSRSVFIIFSTVYPKNFPSLRCGHLLRFASVRRGDENGDARDKGCRTAGACSIRIVTPSPLLCPRHVFRGVRHRFRGPSTYSTRLRPNSNFTSSVIFHSSLICL